MKRRERHPITGDRGHHQAQQGPAPPPPAPPPPAFHGNQCGSFQLQAGVNCFLGHGAQPLPHNYIEAIPADKCVASCAADASCQGTVVPSSGQAQCWKVTNVVTSQCVPDAAYNFCLRPGLPAAHPNPPAAQPAHPAAPAQPAAPPAQPAAPPAQPAAPAAGGISSMPDVVARFAKSPVVQRTGFGTWVWILPSLAVSGGLALLALKGHAWHRRSSQRSLLSAEEGDVGRTEFRQSPGPSRLSPSNLAEERATYTELDRNDVQSLDDLDL